MELEGQEHELNAPDDTYIMDSAETAGVELPFSAGLGRAPHVLAAWTQVKSASRMDPFLMNHRLMRVMSLTCVSYPRADCVNSNPQGS